MKPAKKPIIVGKEEAFFYECPDWNKDKIIVYNKNYNKISSASLKKIETEAQMGLVCSLIAKGNTLKSTCSGVGWRPSYSFFLNKIKYNPKFENMYRIAKEIRMEVLTEELIELKNSKDENSDKKINNLTKILSVFKANTSSAPVLQAILWAEKDAKKEDFI